MLMFSVKVAKPVPLKAPSVDAILVDFAVELVEPEVVVPEEVLPGEVLVGEDVVLRERASISYVRKVDSLQHCRLTCSLCRTLNGTATATTTIITRSAARKAQSFHLLFNADCLSGSFDSSGDIISLSALFHASFSGAL